MQKVYESSTAPEAHMVKILLESKGFRPKVDGEHLPSGAGMLPAINLVSVLIDDEDYFAASEIIDEWESSQNATKRKQDPKKMPKGLIGFLMGAVFASAVVTWIHYSPVQVGGIDHNADGQLDETWIYKNNLLSEMSYDRNLDGVVDQKYIFGTSGIIKSAEIDYDFDGTFETKQIYRKGNIVSEVSDWNQNGIVEYRVLYRYGVVNSVEFIDEETRKVRKLQHYESGRLVSAEFDSSGDGILDTKYKYNEYEEIQ